MLLHSNNTLLGLTYPFAMSVKRLLKSLLFVFALFASFNVDTLNAQTVHAPHVEVELVSEKSAISAGESFWVALRFKLEDEWHIYWKNPGDSGLPPSVQWKTPGKVSIDDISWPLPERIPFAHLVNYGYEEQVFLPALVHVSEDFSGSSIRIQAEADWLVCKEDCIPGEAVLALELAAYDSDDQGELATSWAPKIEATVSNLPVALPELEVTAREDDGFIYLEFQSAANLDHQVEGAIFFPDTPRQIENSADQVFDSNREPYLIRLQRARNASEPLRRLTGVLHSENGWGTGDNAALIDLVLIEDDTDEFLLASLPGNGEGAFPGNFTGSFWLVVLFAFLGGLILNAMPCVFPVISIKILSFVRQAGEDPSKVRTHGLLFSSGVIISFLILGFLLFALRAGGAELGWGFQLQSPLFIAAMAFLFTFLGLVFLGAIDIGYKLQNVAGNMSKGAGLSGSFFSGVLATAIASPCTAPFMGYALAIAVAVPISLGLLIFFCLGLGMASPYLLLSFAPALLKYLPKPGAWMETFKQIMAFPLLGTVIWLLSVYGQQLGFDAAIGLLTLLFLFCFCLFLYGRFKSKNWKIAFSVLSLLILTSFGATSVAWKSVTSIELADGIYIDEHNIHWEPYSPERYEELMRSDMPVYIDFTAAWCITCIVNKKVVFSSSSVREKLKKHNVVMIRADWTSRNPEITEALAKFNRNGVPLNVIYGNDKSTPPVILPTLLTPGVVLGKLSEIFEKQDT